MTLFTINIHVPRDDELSAVLDQIRLSLEQIMSTQSEHAAELRNVTVQNEKSRLEIVAKIKTLEEAIAAGGSTTTEVDEALAALKASVQMDDDLHPDVPA